MRSPRRPRTGSRSLPRPSRSPWRANGSVTLTWPEATNGTGTGGTAGPSLATLKSEFGGGTGFWGYNIYRENPGSTTYGLVGQVPENTGATYSFTDTGSAAGRRARVEFHLPVGHQPRHRLLQRRRQLAAGHQHHG